MWGCFFLVLLDVELELSLISITWPVEEVCLSNKFFEF